MKIELEMFEYPMSKPVEPGKYLVFMKSENKEGWGWRFFDGTIFWTGAFDAPLIWWLENPPVPPYNNEIQPQPKERAAELKH